MCRFFKCCKKKRLRSYDSPSVRHVPAPAAPIIINVLQIAPQHRHGTTVIDIQEALRTSP